MMDESTKVESTEVDKTTETEAKPSEYEVKLRKENEKLRKELNAKLEAESKAKEEALKAQNEFKTLYEGLKPEYDTLKAESETIKGKLEAIETETRKELLARFPEGKQDVVKDLPLEKLRALAALENESITTDKTRTFSKAKPTDKTFNSFAEWEAHMKSQGKLI